MAERVSVEKDNLMTLLEYAEELFSIQEMEFSNKPSDDDRVLMLAMYRRVGKEVPPFLARTFGWKHSEVEPDERD